MRMSKIGFLIIPIVLVCGGWGFFAHRHINQLAIYRLPPEMMGFYKSHVRFLRDAAVQPDKRRYAVPGEAECHFIDLDHYPGNALSDTVRWQTAIDLYGEDSLRRHGILPWNLVRVYQRLREAFLAGDRERVLHLSADLGHYVGDANVPLHTTSNYDGQQTGQHGLHGLWESRLPELHYDAYDFLLGPAQYVPDVRARVWADIRRSQTLVDSVLMVERMLFQDEGVRKFTFETRGNQTVRVVGASYASRYHRALNGMVERQMRNAVATVSDLWYTAWVEAGQPDLRTWNDRPYSPEAMESARLRLQEWKVQNLIQPRPHETGPD